MHTISQFFLKPLAALLVALVISGCSSKNNTAHFLEAAKKHFDGGEFEKAKAEYIAVLRQDRQNATALGQLALIWMEQGAPLRAIPLLMEVRKRTPNDVVLRTKLMEALAAMQSAGEAHKEAAAILDLDPGNEKALIYLSATARSAEEIEATRQRIEKFPARESAAAYAATAPLFLREGDTAAAESALRNALDADPKLTSARTALARVLAAKKDSEGMEREFKTVSELAPVRSQERLAYANLKLGQGAIDEARTLAAAVTSQAADYLPAWILSAQVAMAAKNYEEAQTHLQKVIDIDTDHFEARMLQAQAVGAEGKAKPAADLLEKLLATYPDHPTVKFRLAQAYIQTKEPDKAVPLLTQAVAAVPDFVEAALLLAGLKMDRGQAEEVISEMRALLEKRPGLVAAMEMLALATRSTGKPDEAVKLLTELAKSAPTDPKYQFQLGLTQRQAGKRSEARLAFEEVLKLSPASLAATSQLVDLDLIDKNFDSALQRVQPLLDKAPPDKPTEAAEAHMIRGKIFVVQQKWDEAEAALRKSIEADPAYAPAYQLLTQVFVSAKKIPQALEHANQVVAKQPENQQALLMAALLSEQLKEFAAARDHYEKLIALKPDLALAHNNLANLYAQELKDLDKAVSHAKEARKLQPPADAAADASVRRQASAIADTLGWIHYQRGEFGEASALIREAARELGDNPEVQYHLGMTAAMMGETENARAALTAALKPDTGLPADFPARAEIQTRLDLLANNNAAAAVSLKDLEALAAKQPADPVLQLRLAGAIEKEMDFPRAAAIYEKVLKQNPALGAASISLALLYAGPLKNPKKALELIKSSRQLTLNDVAAAGTLGGIAFSAGDFSLAYDLLRQGSRAEKPDADILRNLAWASYNLSKIKEARETMQRLVDGAPDAPQAADAKSFLALTALITDPKALDEAATAAEAVLQSDPSHVPALLVRARKQFQQGEAAPAIATCMTALRGIPDFAPAQKQLAKIYAADPQTRAKASELAVKARVTLPDDPELTQTLAELSYHKRDYAYAIQLLAASARTKPLDAEGLFYLGAAQSNTDDKPAARKSLTDALAAGLSEPLSTEAGRMLEKLGTE